MSKFKKRIKRIGLGILLLPIILLGILYFIVTRPTVYKGEHKPTNGNTASIILIDGLKQDLFQSALADGKLPHIQALIDKGTYVKNGIASFPSMTGYGYYPFITGRDALESGIIGLRWFDRSLDKGNLRNYVGRTNVWMNQDISDSVQNIFELANDQYTASINSFMNKGVDDSRITGWAHTTAKFKDKSIFGPLRKVPVIGKTIAIDHLQHESNVMKMAIQQLDKNPKAQWITLPSPDASNHINGTTKEYHQLLSHIDHLIGDFLFAVDSLGQSKHRMIAIVTDHGTCDVSKNIDVVKECKKIGLDIERGKSVYYRSMLLDRPIEEFAQKHGHLIINGNLASMMYFRNDTIPNKDGWRRNLTLEELSHYKTGDKIIDIPLEISQIEGIEFVIYKSHSKVFIRDQKGYAIISEEKGKYKYSPISSDPLSYSNMNLTDSLMSASTWLNRTISTKYPDAIHRIMSLMKSPINGDLVITSKDGYDLANDYEVIVGNYKGGHGGIRDDQLRVPYVLFTPNQSAQTIDYARAEEVGIMIVNWLY